MDKLVEHSIDPTSYVYKIEFMISGLIKPKDDKPVCQMKPIPKSKNIIAIDMEDALRKFKNYIKRLKRKKELVELEIGGKADALDVMEITSVTRCIGIHLA